MKIPFKQISTTLVIGAIVVLNGCSSDDSTAASTVPAYTGKTTPASITVSNAKAVGSTATEAANEAINVDKGNTANPFGVSIVDKASFSQHLISITRTFLDTAIATNMPTGITLTADDFGGAAQGFCGGSVTIPDNAFSSQTLNGSFTYNNFCYDDSLSGQIIINGTVVFTESATEITMTYVNFTVTSGGETQSFNATITCDTSFQNCSNSSTFVGSDGEVHSIDDFTVVDSGTGYDVSATFFHNTYGEVSITTSAEITFGACGVFPDGGVISITSSTGSYITVTFDSTCTYTITGHDGSAPFGPISGSWL